ncbi:MAG: molybdopterin molybdotransferase MoeA [Immundisolibacter sp.]|uniref:molybdopterin molybdotransferase MoeA n=1 Tax=Immundisolibacter sp. TaxID=1934948 RepID=UPI003EE41CB5
MDQSALPDCTPASLDVEAALAQVLDALTPLPGSEQIALDLALGRVLAQPLVAAMDLQPWPNSAMDGYAFAVSDLDQALAKGLALAGTSMAGHPFTGTLDPGECVRILTGAILPAGCDTVAMQEHVAVHGDQIRLTANVPRGANVRAPGEDVRTGSVVLPAGTRLGPPQIALAAALGQARVVVNHRPRVALFTSGDELTPLGQPLAAGAIYDSNRYLLRAMLQQMGMPVIDLGIVADDPDAVRSAFAAARAQADVVISSGGVSVGDADYVREVFSEFGDIHFWRIAMKPGRPLAFGRLDETWFFGLPGNPVSTAVTFLEFVRPALCRLEGEPLTAPLRVELPLLEPLRKAPGRMDFQRGIVAIDKDGRPGVRSAGPQGSHVMSSLAAANCLLVLPAASGDLPAGSLVEVELLPWTGTPAAHGQP